MKVRVTLLAENDEHSTAPIEDLTSGLKNGWEFVCKWLTRFDEDLEKVTLENVEVVEP